MNPTAYIFPGQGSQYVGMGRDLCEKNAAARELFARADKILDISLSGICFDGPEQELKQTKNTQPAIFLHSIALTQLVEHGDAAMAAGHSLGEYSALVFAGAVLPAPIREQFIRKIPLGRIGHPSDIADVVAFLASDGARYISGQCIQVDGALSVGVGGAF